ncbi:putative peptidyl-prolyl cis-trans isomerase [Paratrimastix pyriformis]|uniref:peptidylprolyl isomerase n=1 Tax=Paratrimastix pyriformis TaxID=342808 RepID=A0ABQ8UNC5_9EUKA|nr:putative peptidyl-prolyl cis-trans isomerase [Paratrimastix pyriformis]
MSSEQAAPVPGAAISLAPDDAVMKEILREGKGPLPTPLSTVSVHYVGTLLNGTKFDSSRDRGTQFTFKLGAQQVIKGWDVGVASMHVGELARFTIKPDYAYGDAAQASIPANSTLVFEVELFSFETLPETPAQKLQFGLDHKQSGNELVKQGAFAEALGHYKKAIDTRAQHRDLVVQLRLNMALCHLKVGQPASAVEMCTKVGPPPPPAAAPTNPATSRPVCLRTLARPQVLEGEPNNAKALYRRACAHHAVQDFDLARRDLVAAAKLAPADRAIREEYAKVQQDQSAAERKARSAYSGLFSRITLTDDIPAPTHSEGPHECGCGHDHHHEEHEEHEEQCGCGHDHHHEEHHHEEHHHEEHEEHEEHCGCGHDHEEHHHEEGHTH